LAFSLKFFWRREGAWQAREMGWCFDKQEQAAKNLCGNNIQIFSNIRKNTQKPLDMCKLR
jgi:hypothetical protein